MTQIKRLSFFISALLFTAGLQLDGQVNQKCELLSKKTPRSSIFDSVDAQDSVVASMPQARPDVSEPDAQAVTERKLGTAQEAAVQQDKKLLEQTGDSGQFGTTTEGAIDEFVKEAAEGPVDKKPTQALADQTEQIKEQDGPEKAEKPDVQTETFQPGQRRTPKQTDQAIGAYPGSQTQQNFDQMNETYREIQPKEEKSDTIKTLGDDQDAVSDDERIEFYFEDADITNLLSQVSDMYNVEFITDEAIDPLGPGGKALKGNKISFKTHKPLSRKAAWSLFLTFLDLAGFALVPEAEPGFYRVVPIDRAQKSAVPAYIGVDASTLPDNDQIVRFVYFIENAEPNTIKDIVNTLKSPNARALILQELKALVITDKAYNIKSLMQIVQELDQVSMPQSMSVLKLQRADATDVKKLYDTISKPSEDGRPPTRLFGGRKQPESIYFPENARLIAEPRSNSLVLLGPQDAIEKIEDFIFKYVDVELEKPYSPLYTYQLRYANAVTVSDIMNNMSQFGADSPAGQTGGVRGGDKYLKPMSFTPEPTTNTIVIKGDYEDYLKALEVIKKLDEPQPQVAIEALIMTVNFDDNKQIGAQIRNKQPGPDGLLGNNVDFQTSGFLGNGIQTNDSGPGSERLLANLINLATNAGAGNTIVSLGADAFGVWGIFQVLQSITNAQVVSNPFLVASNKTKAAVSIGEIRRVVTSTVFAGENPADAFGDFEAELKLEVTPQINSDGMIILKLNVLLENFVGDLTNPQEAAKQSRTVDTRTIVADREVIAIGGLIQNRVIEILNKVPILGDIPIFGWLFRNKTKNTVKDNLLILISTRIIEPEVTEIVDQYTQEKLEDYYETSETFHDVGEYRDPVYRRFFEDEADDPSNVVEDFLFRRRKEEVSPEKAGSVPTKKDVTKAGKFFKPGQERDKAIVKQFELSKEDQVPQAPASQQLPRSGLLKSVIDDQESIKMTDNKPKRRRDPRRSLSQFNPDQQKGVVT